MVSTYLVEPLLRRGEPIGNAGVPAGVHVRQDGGVIWSIGPFTGSLIGPHRSVHSSTRPPQYQFIYASSPSCGAVNVLHARTSIDDSRLDDDKGKYALRLLAAVNDIRRKSALRRL